MKLTHTFGRKGEDFDEVEAVLVAIDGAKKQVKLVRVSDSKVIKVSLDRLNKQDRSWITTRVKLVKEHGDAIAKILQESKGNSQ